MFMDIASLKNAKFAVLVNFLEIDFVCAWLFPQTYSLSFFEDIQTDTKMIGATALKKIIEY